MFPAVATFIQFLHKIEQNSIVVKEGPWQPTHTAASSQRYVLKCLKKDLSVGSNQWVLWWRQAKQTQSTVNIML
jgi:hypothetical protein